MIAIGCVSLLLLSFVNNIGKLKKKKNNKNFWLLTIIESFLAGNCLLGGGCGSGLCCSAFGACGVQYCGVGAVAYPGWAGSPYLGGDCRVVGCGSGYCCSPYG